jgi:hypothetical protein
MDRTMSVGPTGAYCSGSRSNKVKAHSVSLTATPVSPQGCCEVNQWYEIHFGADYAADLPRTPTWARVTAAVTCISCRSDGAISTQSNSCGHNFYCCGGIMKVSIPVIAHKHRLLLKEMAAPLPKRGGVLWLREGSVLGQHWCCTNGHHLHIFNTQGDSEPTKTIWLKGSNISNVNEQELSFSVDDDSFKALDRHDCTAWLHVLSLLV